MTKVSDFKRISIRQSGFSYDRNYDVPMQQSIRCAEFQNAIA